VSPMRDDGFGPLKGTRYAVWASYQSALTPALARIRLARDVRRFRGNTIINAITAVWCLAWAAFNFVVNDWIGIIVAVVMLVVATVDGRLAIVNWRRWRAARIAAGMVLDPPERREER
jgi:hypothetical protein